MAIAFSKFYYTLLEKSSFFTELFFKPISPPPPALGTYFDGISYEVTSDEGISNDRNRYKQLQRSFIFTAIVLLRKVEC